MTATLVDPQEPLKRRKLAWFINAIMHDSLRKTVMKGTLESNRRRGRQKKSCMNNVKKRVDIPSQG
ncbi:hypothetical protein DPMN_130402 [Dreissena polymorpha]|uniref:Uncharacterized protein n=1 Tax=Dreissena polymorpha TaxID=45954 RepID=A0A9D4JXJ2_DREPO|nr:hypothetical protein DPMN_130402 [Dreissena polymorpha]